MKQIAVLIIGIFMCIAYNLTSQNVDYEKTPTGIVVEVFDDNSSLTRYNDDNTVYKSGKKFRIEYSYINLEGEEFLFAVSPNKKWKFVPKNSITDSTITHLIMEVMPDLSEFIKYDSSYNQTIIKYYYYNSENKMPFRSSTGVIENVYNIWMHPPRDHMFKILEINPFPYIKHEKSNLTKWKWSLTVGDYWSVEECKTWKGDVKLKYKYKILKDKEYINIGDAKHECTIVEAEQRSRLGKSYLKSYYNQEHGFLRLEYTNVDKTKINLDFIPMN